VAWVGLREFVLQREQRPRGVLDLRMMLRRRRESGIRSRGLTPGAGQNGALKVAPGSECCQTTWRQARLREFFARIANLANYAVVLLYDNRAWTVTFMSRQPCSPQTFNIGNQCDFD